MIEIVSWTKRDDLANRAGPVLQNTKWNLISSRPADANIMGYASESDGMIRT